MRLRLIRQRLISEGEGIYMAKTRDKGRKDEKKKPQKTQKEKRQEKIEKKKTQG